MNTTEEIINLRTPKTNAKLISPILKRFSPRVFNNEAIANDDIEALFEAAKLAPSGRNHQPWQYVWMRQGSKAYEKLFQSIPERNGWAKTAPVMIIASYDPSEPSDGVNKWAQYDLGQATISLILQAQELGYYCRQIGSFDAELTKKNFAEIPAGFQPLVLLAIGRIGNDNDYAQSTPEILEKEKTAWERKNEIACEAI